MSSLQNKQVLLTGASGGIGQSILAALVAAGANVIITGRNAQALEAARAAHPENVRLFAGDLNDAETRSGLLRFCELQGGIDILINNAGISQFGRAEQQQSAALVTTNLLTPIVLCQTFLPMLKQRKGTILNIGSTFGSIGYPGFSAYCASKAGLRGYTEALARELSGEVRVQYLAPRATRTSINSPAVDQLNAALGQGVDTPEYVAQQLVQQLVKGDIRRYLGWPERLFVVLNAVFPSLVDKALIGKLGIIRQYIDK